MIRVGQRLNIWLLPTYTSQTKDLYTSAQTKEEGPVIASGSKTYFVKDGDTLWDISRSSNVSVEQIKKLNNLRSNTIHVGQQLVLGIE